MSKHQDCCGKEMMMEELEKRRGSKTGKLMRERMVRFEDQG